MESGRKYSVEEARIKLESFCAYQDRCIQEVNRKIQGWGLTEGERELLIEHLRSNAFLDEKRFTEAFVSGKFNIKKWGRIKIKTALKVKGIHSGMIDNVIQEMDEDQYLANLNKLLEKKEAALQKDDEYTKRVKITRFLLSKGYESNLIHNALDDFFKGQ